MICDILKSIFNAFTDCDLSTFLKVLFILLAKPIKLKLINQDQNPERSQVQEICFQHFQEITNL